MSDTASENKRGRAKHRNLPGGPTAADGAAWALAEEATRTGREQLQLLLAQPEALVRMHQRFANLDEAQQAGHYFEWQQELSFNLDAVARHSDVRARVTEWLGEPHAPADLRLYGPSGDVLSEIQTKVITSTAHRVSPVDGLAADKYDHMQLVVPSDHLAPSEDLLDRRLGMPIGSLHNHYQDVHDRLNDHVSLDGVASEPISRAELHHLTVNPDGHLNDLILHDQLGQLFSASETAGVASGAITALASLAVAAARSKSLNGLPWMDAGLRAARSASRSVVVASGGQGISLLAQHAVASGGANALVEGLAGSSLPIAMARCVFDIAGVAHGFATGHLTTSEAAAATAQIVGRNTAVWACASVGQAIIPIPIVGSLVGAAVGQLGTVMVVKGIQLAIMARNQRDEWDAAYELLLQQTGEVQASARAEIERLAMVAEANDTAFAQIVLPLLADITAMAGSHQADEVLDRLADLTRQYAGTPLFSSLLEFDAFMTASDAVLVIDLGAAR